MMDDATRRRDRASVQRASVDRVRLHQTMHLARLRVTCVLWTCAARVVALPALAPLSRPTTPPLRRWGGCGKCWYAGKARTRARARARPVAVAQARRSASSAEKVRNPFCGSNCVLFCCDSRSSYFISICRIILTFLKEVINEWY